MRRDRIKKTITYLSLLFWLMLLVAFLTCVFVGFIVKPETIMDEVESSTQKFKSKKLYIVLIKYVAPILLLLILFSSVLNALGIITL